MKNEKINQSILNKNCIKIENLEYKVDGKNLLNVSNLEIPMTGMTAIVGPNGSGKTTLIRLIARQLIPTKGKIFYRETLIADLSPKELAKTIAYLPQDLPETSNFTGYELISLGRHPWHRPFSKKTWKDEELINLAIGFTEVEKFNEKLLNTLSGGERQRVWLTMLLAQDTNILLLDEPISALDINHQIGIIKLLRKLCSNKNKSIIMVIHDINFAYRFFDQVVALKDGNVVANGTPENVITEKTLLEIFDIEMKIMKPTMGNPSIIYVND